ncbi:hypothetical protein [Streptomyces graminofaciens]|uniref:hypothetical protein n=1 Tax=Streptomyces graminofaciens TaxID=68212 RepID=UPI0025724DD7|nr:hypothetical protein [Streptomyces graminofaciens]
MSERPVRRRSSQPRLPAKLGGQPSVRAVPTRRAADVAASPPPTIDAAWLRELCLASGADDATAASLDHLDLAGERGHALAALPGARSLISLAVRMNRDNTRSRIRPRWFV